MIDSQIKYYDGDYEIIFSEIFNIYENKLVIQKIENFEFTFLFEDDLSNKQSLININGDNNTKKVIIKLTNFKNTLGIATTKKLQILSVDKENKKIFFSIHVKSLNESNSFKEVSITFYKRYEEPTK